MSDVHGPVRVLVVEDSDRLRARIVTALEADPSFRVIGQAADGRTAIERCLHLRPDVVTMDVRLPVVNGLMVTQELMRRCPTPILIISAADGTDDMVSTFAALGAGAVDVLDKPRGAPDDPDWDRRLVAAVRMVARIRVVTRFGAGRGAGSSPTGVPPVTPAPDRWGPVGPVRPAGEFAAVAIGASTGGPAAVASVLGGLPSGLTLPVLLVLHVSETFGPAIAAWLKDVTGRAVRLARSGEALAAVAGEVIMAPPGQHLAVSGGLLNLNHEPERHSCRPSVDVLFESLARDLGPRVAACLLTGMGRDGATGLLEVHRAGGVTIAQDEETSVVHGMPGEAVRLGAAQHVLPVEAIGAALARLTASPVEPR